MKHIGWIVFTTIVALAPGCGGDACQENVPFSVDYDLSQAEADRLATELGVASIEGMCDAACTQISDENMSPDGSTFSVTTVDTCSLTMPSTDASGNPVTGFVRCAGSGARCE
jgi:hypothetical protein